VTAGPARTLRLVLATACALPVCLMQAAPAQAEPVFIGSATSLSVSVTGGVGGAGCGSSQSTTGSYLPVVENGGTASLANEVVLKGDHNAVQIASGTESVAGHAAVTSAGGLPRTLDLTASGQGQLTFSQDGTGCVIEGGGNYNLSFELVLPSPVYLDLAATITGRGVTDVELHAVDGPAFTGEFAMSFAGTRNTRLLLPAATYAGTLSAGAVLHATTSTSASGSASLHGVFTPLGAQLSPPSGKAGKYVALPASASCANGTLTAAVSSSRKRAAKVRTAVVRLASTKKKVRTPKKGQAISVPFTGSQPQTLTATVTLARGHGKKPKVLTVSATYEACS
jgi:hypothetical protein